MPKFTHGTTVRLTEAARDTNPLFVAQEGRTFIILDSEEVDGNNTLYTVLETTIQFFEHELVEA